MMNIAYFPNQGLNGHHRGAAAKTTRLLIRNLFHRDMSSLQSRLSLNSLAFVRSLLSKLLMATTAEIYSCLPWQNIGELQ